jgi:hypothetical protein
MEDSLVVTDPTTNSTLGGLSKAERTGCRIFHWVWSYARGTSERSGLNGDLKALGMAE